MTHDEEIAAQIAEQDAVERRFERLEAAIAKGAQENEQLKARGRADSLISGPRKSFGRDSWRWRRRRGALFCQSHWHSGFPSPIHEPSGP
jgi:hypothetical protein